MTKSRPAANPREALIKYKSVIVGSIVVAALLYTALVFIQQEKTGDIAWSGSALTLFAGMVVTQIVTWLASAGIYTVLSQRRLLYLPTCMVEVAGSFVGKVLPSGIGSVGVNFWYLRKVGHPNAVAGTIVAINNLLGAIGHTGVLVVLAVFAPFLVGAHLGNAVTPIIFIGLIVVLIIAALAARTLLGRRLRQVYQLFGRYRKEPWRLAAAQGLSLVITLSNIAILWMALIATGVAASSLLVAAIALTVGLAAQTITPTPGGLGGVEAGIAASLIASGISLSDAVAATVLFRLVTYWLPIVVGGVAMLVAVRRSYL